MVMTIGETAGTFKSVVRPLRLNEVSYIYRVFFEGTEDSVLRFDLPQELTIRLGSHYNGGSLRKCKGATLSTGTSPSLF